MMTRTMRLAANGRDRTRRWQQVAVALVLACPVAMMAQDALSAIVRPVARADSVTIPLEPAPAFPYVGVLAGIPMGIELAPRPMPDERLRSRRQVATVSFPPNAYVTVQDVLTRMLQAVPGYEAFMDGSVVAVAPRDLRGDDRHFLNRRIASFDVKDVALKDALRAAWSMRLPAGDGGVGSTGQRSSGGGGGMARGADMDLRFQRREAVLARHVSLSLRNATLRQVLDRLAEQSGEFVWTVSYRWGTEPSEHTCNLEIEAVNPLGGYPLSWPCK
jgi:hypothetical protein